MKKFTVILFIGLLATSCSNDAAEPDAEITIEPIEKEVVEIKKEKVMPKVVNELIIISDQNEIEEGDLAFKWDVDYQDYEGKATETNVKLSIKGSKGAEMLDVCTLQEKWENVNTIKANGVSAHIVLALKSINDDEFLVIEKTATGTYDLLLSKIWYDSFTLVYNLGEIQNNDGIVDFELQLPKDSKKIIEYGQSFPWPIID